MLVASPARASLSSVYVGQSSAGSGTGTNCANQEPVTFFTTSGNWGAGSTQIGAGTTVHLCGTITTVLSVLGSGSSGSPITIQWEVGAQLSSCSTTGSIKAPGRSWIVMDLGGNIPGITCPNNGTGLSTTTNACGVTDGTTCGTFGGSGFTNVEVRNGTIGPLYVHTSTGSDGINSTGVAFDSHGGNKIHNLSINNAAFSGLVGVVAAGTANDEISFITMTAIGTGFWYASEGSPGGSSGFKFHDNDYTVSTTWATAANSIHMEMIHIFGNGTGTTMGNSEIYNNYAHGSWPTSNGTTFIFIEQATCGDGGVQTANIFNNLLSLNGSAHIPGDGLIYIACQHETVGIYNNTMDCASVSGSAGMQLDGGTADAWTVENNIFLSCPTNIFNTSSGTLTADFNSYSTGNWQFAGVTKTTFASWKTACSCDSHAITGTPGLNSDYTITGVGSAVYQTGTNLTSLSITDLDTGKPGAVGNQTGPTGTPRSASVAWDMGVYPFGSSSGGGSCTVF